MGQGNEQPPVGLMALGAGALVLCCLAPLVLLSIGTAGLAALIAGNAWWLGLGGLALIIGAVVARMRRRAGPPATGSRSEEKGTAHE
jgi:hypothetical protein